MKFCYLFLSLLFSQFAFAQLNFGGSFGTTGYLGDLNHDPFKRIKPAVTAFVGYELNNRVQFKSSLLLGKVEGSDQDGKHTDISQSRNLSFQSGLTELNVVAELNFLKLNPEKKNQWTPYGFAGLGILHFDPYVIDSGEKVFLKPLSTEGEGLNGRKNYSLVQLVIPFGGGIKYMINKNIVVGAEASARLLFTDYLDDVATTYVDKNTLLAARGPKAVKLAYRGPGQYPVEGTQRGHKSRDWYYFVGFHFTYRLDLGITHPTKQKETTEPTTTSGN